MIGCLLAAYLIDPKLCLIAMIGVPPAAIAINTIRRKIKKYSKRALRGQAGIMGNMQEKFLGIRIIKAFVAEDREKRLFRDLTRKLFKINLKVARARSATSPLLSSLTIIGLALFVYFGGVQVLDVDGRLTSIQFFTFCFFVLGAFAPIRSLSKVYNAIIVSTVAGTRVFEYLDKIPSIQDRPGAKDIARFQNEIRFNNVSFSYDGQTEVLKNINLVARKGQIVALVGPSGAGKTTLVSLIPRFYDVKSGKINVDGNDIRDLTIKSFRNQTAIVTQETMLFNVSAEDNIRYGDPGADRKKVEAAAKAANADGFIRDFGDGYETLVGERGETLSGGQRQRIAIARAILKDPSILILDEATSSLDSESERAIQQALDEFMKDRTTFVIAHRLSTILRADQILVMNEGRIVQRGTHAELLRLGGLYRRLYETQFAVDEPAGSPDIKSDSHPRIWAGIPARYASNRFPGKVLERVAGKSILEHVWDRVNEAEGIDGAFIATDDSRIQTEAEKFGARAIMTSPDHASGTDRLAEALNQVEADILINVQGDEPLIDPKLISQLAQTMRADPDLDMATLATRICDPEEIKNPNVVKVVLAENGDALYFSRSPVASGVDSDGSPIYYKHFGVYAYRVEKLKSLTQIPPKSVEMGEKLEQLRAVEVNTRIRVLISEVDSIGVDTPADLEKVRERIEHQMRASQQV